MSNGWGTPLYPPYEPGPTGPEYQSYQAYLDTVKWAQPSRRVSTEPSQQYGAETGYWFQVHTPTGFQYKWIPPAPTPPPYEEPRVAKPAPAKIPSYETLRWGRPFEEVTEYARPEYEPAWYGELEARKPTVSPARYSWMAGLRPELLRQWQAQLPVSEAEFAQKPYEMTYEIPPVTEEEMRARAKELERERLVAKMAGYSTEFPSEIQARVSDISGRVISPGETYGGATHLETIGEGEPAGPPTLSEEERRKVYGEVQRWAEKELYTRAQTAEKVARSEAQKLAKTATAKREAKWGKWLGAYPFTQEWYGMAPRTRGEYPGRFAPPVRWYL